MSIFTRHFNGKRVLVSGAGKGLGYALTKELHSLGAKVYAVSRTQSDLDELEKECPGIEPICLELGDWDNTREMLSAVLKHPIDILVNNAAIGKLEAFMEVTSHSFDTITSVNLKAVINLSQICAQTMIDSGNGGSIINISSMYAIRPEPKAPMYSALKAAMDSLTKTMAMELGPHKIQVVGLNLGFMETNMTDSTLTTREIKQAFEEAKAARFPMRQVWVPLEEAVNTILFVASGMAGTMTGTGVLLDGGYCAS